MSSAPSAVTQTSHQAFPQLSGPIVDAGGMASLPLARLLISMWQKLGGSLTTVQNTAIITQQPTSAGAPLQAVAPDGTALGTLFLTSDINGGPAQAQTLAASPFVLGVTTKIGTVVVSSGKVELSRDGGTTWLLVSLVGGAVPKLSADLIRVTWFGDPPAVTFLPWS